MNKLVLANGIGACVASWNVEHYNQYVTGSTDNGAPADGYNDWQYNDSWVLLNKNIEYKWTAPGEKVGGNRFMENQTVQRSHEAHSMEWYAHTRGKWAGLRHGLSDALWNLKRWERVYAESEYYDMGFNPATDGNEVSSQGETPRPLQGAWQLPKNIWFRYETRGETGSARQTCTASKSVYFKETTLRHVRQNKRDLGTHDLDHQNQNNWNSHNGMWNNGNHNYGDINKDDWCPVIGVFDAEGYSLGIVLNTSAQRNKYLGWEATSFELCNASQNASKALRHLMTSGAAAGHYNNNGQAEDWVRDETTGKWSKVAVSKDGAKKDAKDGKAKKKEEGCCGCSCCCCVVIISLIVLAAAGVVLVLCCCCKKNQDDDSL